ncbi:MAG: type II toxin-antitoxin system VapB family antitoxin [Candidatus Tectomicrobia bacterium]|nr:type II toxin-antitoxin system VapB family antitoxin [Candidatus Tectomicrobia bacterium]
MGLNIKNEEAHRLAAQLAALTGETMTKAVTEAIRERIERIQRQRNVPEILARAREIIRHSGGAQPYTDHAELLYDEHGLPK